MHVQVFKTLNTCTRIQESQYVYTYSGHSIRTHVFRILNTCVRIEFPKYVHTYSRNSIRAHVLKTFITYTRSRHSTRLHDMCTSVRFRNLLHIFTQSSGQKPKWVSHLLLRHFEWCECAHGWDPTSQHFHKSMSNWTSFVRLGHLWCEWRWFQLLWSAVHP